VAVEPAKKDSTAEKEARGMVAAMLDRVKMQALASASPKRKGKRTRKQKAKRIVRKRVKEARRRNRR
jgi:hypothetical protein